MKTTVRFVLSVLFTLVSMPVWAASSPDAGAPSDASVSSPGAGGLSPDASIPPSATIACDSRQIFTEAKCPGDGLDPNEAKLVQLINKYRADNSLPPITVSKALTKVANRHVLDLALNVRELTHGWSNCPYDADNPKTHPCMWRSPQRLDTSYPANGYENAYGDGRGEADRRDPAEILEQWKSSTAQNHVLKGSIDGTRFNWRAIGVSIGRGYAVMWVGQESDSAPPETEASVDTIFDPRAEAGALHTPETDLDPGWGKTEVIAENYLKSANFSPALSLDERKVLLLVNQARMYPAKFAEKYIKPIADKGNAAEIECLAEMRAMAPLHPLRPQTGLTYAARDHAIERGMGLDTGMHLGYGGSTPGDRVARYVRARGVSENLAWGGTDLTSLVVLLLGDGVSPTRGHRRNILSPTHHFVGIAVHPMKEKDGLCIVQDFAESVADLPNFDGLPDWIIEKQGFYSMSAGYLQLHAPSGKVEMAQIDMNYVWVDRSIAHMGQVRIGLSEKSQMFALGYALTGGRERGDFHAGILLNLGYAHLYDGSDYVHGMVVGVSPIVMGTLWKNWQFFLTGGLSMIPLASKPIPDGNGYSGFNASVGATTTFR